MHEIERIASEPILTPPKSKRSSPSRTPKVPVDDTPGAAGPSGLARALSHHSADVAASASTSTVLALTPAEALAKDMITRRAQHIRDMYITVDSEPMLKAKLALEAVELLVTRLEAVSSGSINADGDVVELVEQVALLFSNQLSPLSSFELSRSGLVEALLRFTTLQNSDRRQSSYPSLWQSSLTLRDRSRHRSMPRNPRRSIHVSSRWDVDTSVRRSCQTSAGESESTGGIRSRPRWSEFKRR